jgi:hypothetical protein
MVIHACNRGSGGRNRKIMSCRPVGDVYIKRQETLLKKEKKEGSRGAE